MIYKISVSKRHLKSIEIYLICIIIKYLTSFNNLIPFKRAKIFLNCTTINGITNFVMLIINIPRDFFKMDRKAQAKKKFPKNEVSP